MPFSAPPPAVAISGNQFTVGGTATQLWGSNLEGMEYTSVQQGNTATWSGAGGIPNWDELATWNGNYVRVPFHGNSWMGETTYDGAGGSFHITSATATSAVLTTAWTLPTQSAQGTFADLEQRTVNCVEGSNTITWTTPLTTVPSAGSQVDLLVWGNARNNDPQGTYKATLIQAVAELQSRGFVVELDLHWLGFLITILGVQRILTCNNQQPSFADYHAIAVWESICSIFGSNVAGQTVTLSEGRGSFTINNAAIIFGLINEPFLDSYAGTLSASSADNALLVGGTNTRIANGSGGPFNVQNSWTMAGYQAMLNAIRGTGAHNVILVGGNSYAQNMKNYIDWLPTDTLTPAQVGLYCHPYPNQGSGSHPNPYPMTNDGPAPLVGSDTGYAAPSVNDFRFIQAAVTAGMVVFANECGDAWCGTASSLATEIETYGAPGLAELQSKADSIGFSVATFCWNNSQASTAGTLTPPPVYDTQIFGGAIIPTIGQGTQQKVWMAGKPTNGYFLPSAGSSLAAAASDTTGGSATLTAGGAESPGTIYLDSTTVHLDSTDVHLDGSFSLEGAAQDTTGGSAALTTGPESPTRIYLDSTTVTLDSTVVHLDGSFPNITTLYPDPLYVVTKPAKRSFTVTRKLN